MTPQSPDLSAAFLTADYVASAGSTGTFTVSGWATAFTTTGTSTPNYPFVNNGQYNLTAVLTKAGQPISGTLDILGTIPGLTSSSGTLLTGQLSKFGFQSPGGDIFEFTFKVTGGDLAHYYDGQAGVILDATGSGFDGSFANSFATGASQGVSDNFLAVPEPTSAISLTSLFVVGLLALAFCRVRGARLIK